MLARFRPDPFTLALVATVVLASVVPASGRFVPILDWATTLAIGLLFFLYGARLSWQSVVQGLGHWRLHLIVLLMTFAVFPLIGVGLRLVAPGLLTPTLYAGVLFLCTLPSTIQSSVAFTSIAGGNVPAAICSASASNIIGMFLTPVLVGLVLSAHGGGISADGLATILAQLLLPFIAGQLVQPWVGGWARKHRHMLSFVDRGSILLIVYAAFSAAIVAGLWYKVSVQALVTMAVVDAVLLAVVLVTTTVASRLLGYSREDEITIVFCGSKKSLASGVPIAKVIFAGHDVGGIVLPVMLYHQLQLMVCSVLARHYAVRQQRGATPEGAKVNASTASKAAKVQA